VGAAKDCAFPSSCAERIQDPPLPLLAPQGAYRVPLRGTYRIVDISRGAKRHISQPPCANRCKCFASQLCGAYCGFRKDFCSSYLLCRPLSSSRTALYRRHVVGNCTSFAARLWLTAHTVPWPPPLSTKSHDFVEAFIGLTACTAPSLLLFPKSLTAFRKPLFRAASSPRGGAKRMLYFFRHSRAQGDSSSPSSFCSPLPCGTVSHHSAASSSSQKA